MIHTSVEVDLHRQGRSVSGENAMVDPAEFGSSSVLP